MLVEKSGTVRLIDFGLAREIDAPSDGNLRGGVPFYFDPEFARAQRDQGVVAASCLAEQYSVAALIYQMWTGVHYLDWSLEREAMLRQIVEAEPVSFQARRVPPWPELEQILRRALHKDPGQRFPDLRALTQALSALLPQAQERDRQAASVYREPARAADLVERALKRYRLGGEALREGLPDAPRASINYGAGGIAYALLRIAQRRQDARRLALADLWSQKAYALATSDDAFYSAALQIDRNSVGERSLFHSAAGLHCVRALVSAAQRDGVTANRALRAFVQHSLGPNDSVDRASRLDAVIGRASLLLGCSELIETIPLRSRRHSLWIAGCLSHHGLGALAAARLRVFAAGCGRPLASLSPGRAVQGRRRPRAVGRGAAIARNGGDATVRAGRLTVEPGSREDACLTCRICEQIVV